MTSASHTAGLLVVDVQPAYAKAMSRHLLPRLLARIEQHVRAGAPVTMLYSGPDVGADELMDVHYFWFDAGMDETLAARLRWVEKDYGFFRGWMDAGVNDEEIVAALRVMESRRVADSRDVDARKLRQVAPHGARIADPLIWPYHLDRAVAPGLAWATCGGGENECLKEVELFLEARGIAFERQPGCTY